MINNGYQKCIWEKNPDLDKLMVFDNDPVGIFRPIYWDKSYEHVWYIDPKFNPLPDKVWAVKCRLSGEKITGTKEMGYLSPSVQIEFNKHLPALKVDIDPWYPPFWDVSHEHAFELHPIHQTNQRLWVFKIFPTYRKPKDWKWSGVVSPQIRVEYNKELPELNYDLDYIIPWHDLEYEHVWILDKTNLSDIENDIWAVKMSATTSPIGIKEIGKVVPIFPDKLDVIFISYHEPNADENWNRVLEKAPWAKRVDGVKGIFEAHKAAAKLATTDMFYVVDGDAWLVDDWDFNYQPSFFDRKYTHIWRAKNPINDLVYGYGGVKLFSTSIVNDSTEWNTLDLSTTVTSKIKIMDKISNVTAFDTDEKSVWRSAFRECVKLYYNQLQNLDEDNNSQSRLQQWLSDNSNHIFKKHSQDAAQYAIEWTTKNINDPTSLILINNREWVEEQFNKRQLVK